MSVSGRHLLGNEEEKQLLVSHQEMDNPSGAAINYNSMSHRIDSSSSNNMYEEPEDLSHEIQTWRNVNTVVNVQIHPKP